MKKNFLTDRKLPITYPDLLPKTMKSNLKKPIMSKQTISQSLSIFRGV